MGTKSSRILTSSSSAIATVVMATALGLALMAVQEDAFAAQNTVTTVPINEELSLQKTVTVMSVPSDNTLPWGTVRGAASDYVERYPVIIQFYQNGEPVHVAQVNVKGDGSYEYKFRVGGMNSETGEFQNFFEGDYTVNIFRVIPNGNSLA